MAFRFLFSRTDRDQGMEEEDGGGAFEDANGETTMTTPLSAIAEAFEELSRTVGKFNVGLLAGDSSCEAFITAKSRYCMALHQLMQFGECLRKMESNRIRKVSITWHVRKGTPKGLIVIVMLNQMYCHLQCGILSSRYGVRDLVEASKIYGTLNNILDIDVKNDTVKTHGSLSRNLRRVRQGLDLIRALFKNFLSSELLDVLCAFRYCTLKEAASTAYAEVCAPYHTWAVRTAVSTGMYALPTREQLLLKLNETGEYAIAFIARII
ncbi:hypothetical protein RHGRI_033913 [Rhododendron griersonianum]|uniref:Glycolipid transfer protein domain-containing protein n=1 Tax=Rhododendron griersonianum TaxID=479676 RepID=A0AAV6HYJ4_9ERIC|nr:hypothetical protein RHGRI_033913 [Rhododendron griersonianum]